MEFGSRADQQSPAYQLFSGKPGQMRLPAHEEVKESDYSDETESDASQSASVDIERGSSIEMSGLRNKGNSTDRGIPRSPDRQIDELGNNLKIKRLDSCTDAKDSQRSDKSSQDLFNSAERAQLK